MTKTTFFRTERFGFSALLFILRRVEFGEWRWRGAPPLFTDSASSCCAESADYLKINHLFLFNLLIYNHLKNKI